MNKSIITHFIWIAALAWLLSGCAGAPAAPVETLAPVPPSATLVPPTATMLPPTATPTPEPSDTPEPTATVTPVPTPTRSAVRQGVIAFNMSYQGGWGGIHVIQADVSGVPVMLSMYPGIDSRPSWSPDGSQIAFESFRADPVTQEHLDIYMMNSDGSQLSRLTNTDGWYAQPDWSPDGSRIVLSAAESQELADADLAALDLSSKELTRLTNDPAIEGMPSWSPDGSQIAYISNRDGAFDIFTLNVDSGETTQLTRESGDNFHPDWSPDGKRILFFSSRDGDEEIYVMDADGANQSRLTTAPGRDVDPEWSPDSYYFAYGHEEAGVRKIYVSDLDGSASDLLFEMPEEMTAGHPAWTWAMETTSEDPVFGPPICMRDTDGDFEPDTPTTTFSTEDDWAFIGFPYDNMQDGMDFWSNTVFKGGLEISLENRSTPPWNGGEEGFHFTFDMLQHTPGSILVELYLGEKLMQTIECEIVEP